MLPRYRRFLLTHPVWDVTIIKGIKNLPSLLISTHTSRVGCDTTPQLLMTWRTGFLLTHPVWDVTKCGLDASPESCTFLLTHPVWDVTVSKWGAAVAIEISTHTSRVGCDKASAKSAVNGFISTHTSRVGCDVFTLGRCRA